jgi:hypothetical protein
MVQLKKVTPQVGFEPRLMNARALTQPATPVGTGDVFKSGPWLLGHRQAL